jgi:hypothetical protein
MERKKFKAGKRKLEASADFYRCPLLNSPTVSPVDPLANNRWLRRESGK